MVENKISPVHDDICRECSQCFDGECRAYCLPHSKEEKDQRMKDPRALCEVRFKESIKEVKMASIIDLESLKKTYKELVEFKKKYPKAYEEFEELLKKSRMTGYKNICRMILGSTPEDLKGLNE